MAEIKAHITFKAPFKQDPKTLAESVKKVLQTVPISQINQERLDSLGIVSGMVDESDLEKIQALDEVDSVTRDEKRFPR